MAFKPALPTPDAQLEELPPALLDPMFAHNKQWVIREVHRGTRLDEVDATLGR